MRVGGENQPVRDLLFRISTHLDSLAAEVHLLEQAVGEEFAEDLPRQSDFIMRLQRLDFLRQALEDLALLHLFMMEHSSGEIETSIAARLKLAATKGLLHATELGSRKSACENRLGDVDLF